MTKTLIDTKLIAITEKVKRLIFDIPKVELAEKLGISRVTLDNRLDKNNWTYAEKLIIDSLTDKK